MWIKRETNVYSINDLPIGLKECQETIDLLNSKFIIPGFTHPVDVGSWCYSTNKPPVKSPVKEEDTTYLVNPKTVKKERVEFVFGVLDFLKLYIDLNKSPITIRTYLNAITQFINWCNENYVSGLDSNKDFNDAIYNYSEELIDKIRRNKISINTGAALQSRLLKAGEYIYSNSDQSDGLYNIRKIHHRTEAVNNTVVPDMQTAKDAIHIYFQLFTQFTEFVVNSNFFPQQVIVGTNKYSFFPIRIPFVNESNINTKKGLKNKYMAYDFNKARLRTVSEMTELGLYKSEKNIKEAHKNAKNVLLEANNNRFNKNRIEAATMAFQSFIMLFSANTGMNLAQIGELSWSDDFETKKERLLFKTIKTRANGKSTTFNISSGFNSHFKKFIKLRKYLLEYLGKPKHSLLFFSFRNKKISNLGMDFSGRFHKRLKTCFNIQLNISTRMWRAYKADWLISVTDIYTASKILQNSSETISRNYANGNQETNESQINEFLTNYKNLVVNYDDQSIETPVGQCVEQQPIAVTQSLKEPDCKTMEGCLNCVNYRAHADTKDFHKLVSFKYILQQSQILAQNKKHFEITIAPVLKRVNGLLNQIRSCFKGEPIELDKIEENVVSSEILSDYWSLKLDFLIDLGVLT